MTVIGNQTVVGQGYQALYHNIHAKSEEGYAVIDVDGGSCQPSDSSTDLAVDLAAGDLLFDNGHASPGSATVQLDAADASDPRKDVIYWDGSQFTKATGTPAPVSDRQSGATRFDTFRPSPTPLGATEATVIAEVWVPAGASDIGAADINDLRVEAMPLQGAEFATESDVPTGILQEGDFVWLADQDRYAYENGN